MSSSGLCCSYLRVYQPLASLSVRERGVVDRVHASARNSTGPALGLLPADECFEVYEKVVDGEVLYCPAHTRLRWLLGLVAFERSIPDSVVPLFFSREEVDGAHQELELLEREEPDAHPPIVQSVWHVPPRWFVAFDDSERRIEQAGDHPKIRYETTIGTAQQRVGKALDTLTGGVVHPVIVGMIYELKEWLKHFDERSLLELDYASVATLFPADDLADDHSSADVWNAIAALGEGDGMRAGLFYRRVNERWGRPRLRESLN
jgi:hypothetical protein